ncbi:MAG: hypothetical protein OXB95_03280 [Rhodobacteraceae bacterium]|nr:hypothetical protein [Paracoccaceae bacterium]
MNFLAAEPVATAEGTEIEMLGQGVVLQTDTRVLPRNLIVGIRPEHFELGEGVVAVTVKPEMIESLGSERYIYFEMADQEGNGSQRVLANSQADDEDIQRSLVASVPHTGALTEADVLSLSFDPRNPYLFDADTGQAVG